MKMLTIECSEFNHPLHKQPPFNKLFRLLDKDSIESMSITLLDTIELNYYNCVTHLYDEATFKTKLESKEQPENQEFPLHIKFQGYQNILFLCNNQHRTKVLLDMINLFNTFHITYTIY